MEIKYLLTSEIRPYDSNSLLLLFEAYNEDTRTYYDFQLPIHNSAIGPGELVEFVACDNPPCALVRVRGTRRRDGRWNVRIGNNYFVIDNTNIRAKEPEMKEDNSNRVESESGAIRSTAVAEFRYDLFHPIPMKRMARTWAEGAAKYGSYNHELGFPMDDTFNHLLAHVFEYLSGDRSEDHLSHIGCNVFMLMISEELRYDENRKCLRLEGNILSPEMKDVIDEFQKQLRRNKFSEETEKGMKKLFEMKILVPHTGYAQKIENIRSRYFPEIPMSYFLNALQNTGFKIIIGDNNDECLPDTMLMVKDIHHWAVPESQNILDERKAQVEQCQKYIEEMVALRRIAKGEGVISIERLYTLFHKKYNPDIIFDAFSASGFPIENEKVHNLRILPSS